MEESEQEPVSSLEERELRTNSFSFEELQNAWKEYETNEKSKVNQVILQNCVIELEHTKILVSLESSLHADHFKKIQTILRGYLVNKLENDKIEFEVEIKEKPKNGKRLYTQQDKFEYLAEKYPNLVDLKNQLGLDWQN